MEIIFLTPQPLNSHLRCFGPLRQPLTWYLPFVLQLITNFVMEILFLTPQPLNSHIRCFGPLRHPSHDICLMYGGGFPIFFFLSHLNPNNFVTQELMQNLRPLWQPFIGYLPFSTQNRVVSGAVKLLVKVHIRPEGRPEIWKYGEVDLH